MMSHIIAFKIILLIYDKYVFLVGKFPKHTGVAVMPLTGFIRLHMCQSELRVHASDVIKHAT